MTILDYSTTAASNTSMNALSTQGSAQANTIDNLFREHMADEASDVTRHVQKTVGSYTALKTDHNQFWRCTAAVTINLTAAATLTSGWCLWVRAHGGAVTIDPSGAELIDSASTKTLADGQSALIICMGTAFFTVLAGSGTDVVTLAGTQTLTNKTLTSAVITAGTAPTAEGTLEWNSTTNAILVGDGAATQTFRANDWEKIFSGAVSGAANKNFTDLSAYRLIRGSGYLTVATDATNLLFRYSTNNGSSFANGASEYNNLRTINDVATVAGSTASTTAVVVDGALGVGNAAGEFIHFEFELFNFNQASVLTGLFRATHRTAAGAIRTVLVGFDTVGTTARDAFQLTAASGNITGIISVEGLRG